MLKIRCLIDRSPNLPCARARPTPPPQALSLPIAAARAACWADALGGAAALLVTCGLGTRSLKMALKLAAVKALLWRGVLWACRRWARAAPLAPAQLRPALPHPLGPKKGEIERGNETIGGAAVTAKTAAPAGGGRASRTGAATLAALKAAVGAATSVTFCAAPRLASASASPDTASASAGFDLDALVRRVAARSASAPAGGSPLLYGPSRRSSRPLQLSFGAKVRRRRLSLGASIRSASLGRRRRRTRRWRPWGRCCGRRPNSTRPAAAVCAAGHL